MQGTINKFGFLKIQRGQGLTIQQCPFRASSYCGDWCPLFGEPRYDQAVPAYSQTRNPCHITICHNRILELDNFTDEREKE